MATKRKLPTTIHIQYTLNGKVATMETILNIVSDFDDSLMDKIQNYLLSQNYIRYVSNFKYNSTIDVEFIEHKQPYPVTFEIEKYKIGVSFYF